MYEMIYRNRIIGYHKGIPIVGDTFMGHTIWEVDYAHKIGYLTE